MKKKLLLAVSAISASLLLCSCYEGTQMVSSVTFPDPTEPTTEPDPALAEKSSLIEIQNGAYIYDTVGTLTATEYSECNDYADYLYKNYLLNTAVVIADDLKGFTPEEYSALIYNDLFDDVGSGMVFLINNGDNTDILYKTGQCQRFIDETSENDELYKATTHLVVDEYKDAIMIMLKLAEKCPKNIIDNANIFSEDTAKSFSHSLESCPDSLTIIATRNNSGVSNEDTAKSYFERRYSDEDGYIILFDKKTRTVTAYNGEVIPPEKQEVISAAASIAANDDYIGALNKIIAGFGGSPVTISDSDDDYSYYDYSDNDYTDYDFGDYDE